MDDKTKKCNIIITHRGNPPYLKYVLSQLQERNHNANIVLMGDKSNNKYSFIKHVLLKDYFDLADKFAKVYIHKNSTDIGYELFCYQRWFCVYEYMKKHNLDDVFSLDSDVLVYEDLSSLHSFISKYDFALSAKNLEEKNPGLWIAGPPIGYFHKDSLKELCEFFMDSYTNKKYLQLFDQKMSWHKSRSENFGVCDMTHIFFFTQEHRSKFFNFSYPFILNKEKYRIDETILDTTDCVSEGCHKKIVFEKGIPYAFDKKDSSRLRFPLIHFQGYDPINAKEWIKDYYNGKRYKLYICIKKFFVKLKNNILQKKYILLNFIGKKGNQLIFPKKVSYLKNLKINIKGQGNIIDLSGISKIKKKSEITILGNNNHIAFDSGTKILGRLELKIHGDNTIFKSGKEVIVDGLLSVYQQTGANVFIGDKTTFFQTMIQSIHEKTNVIIGKDCMFSKDTFLFNSDGHPIYDYNKKICNKPKNLLVGNHVWIGWGSSILKGINIADNCIIGRASVVTKSISEPGSIIVGNPGKVITNTGKSWARFDDNFLLEEK